MKPSFHFYPRGKKSMIAHGIKKGSFRESLKIAELMKLSDFDVFLKLIECESFKKESQIIIWGHSWEFEKLNLWGELERVMKHISNKYKSNCVSYRKLVTEGTRNYGEKSKVHSI